MAQRLPSAHKFLKEPTNLFVLGSHFSHGQVSRCPEPTPGDILLTLYTAGGTKQSRVYITDQIRASGRTAKALL